MMGTTFFSDLQVMRHMMDRLSDEFDRGLLSVHGWNRKGDTKDWTFTLPVASYWTEDKLNLRIVMPGIDAKDFELVSVGNRLMLRGERKLPEGFEHNESNCFVLPYGRFERTIDLPSGLKTDDLKARFHNGILNIYIPLATPAKPKKLDVVVDGIGEKIKDVVRN